MLRSNFGHFGLHFVRCGKAGGPHRHFVVLLRVAVQATLVAGFVLAMWSLAEVIIASYHLTAKVATQCATSASNLVTPVSFDERILALRAFSDLGSRDCLLNSKSTLCFNRIFRNLFASSHH